MGETKRILLVFSDMSTIHLLERNILSPEQYKVLVARSCAEARKLVEAVSPDLMILGDKLVDGDYIELATNLLERQPTLPIILMMSDENAVLSPEVIRLGLVDWLTPPIKSQEMRTAVERGLKRSKQWENWLKMATSRYTGPLIRRVDELETLSRVGRLVTAQLDLDGVLKEVVDAAVEITSAEEGSILLVDEGTDELYVRAARNFREDFVRTFRLPVEDTHAGEVIKTGEPVVLHADAPHKIKTAYLVQSLIYVPLVVHGRTIGVLGVDHRQTEKAFEEHHVALLSAMADFAAIAIENAKLYSQTDIERDKLENILTQIKDGVIVVSDDYRLLLVNHTVRRAFGLGDEDFTGKQLEDVFQDRDLLMAIKWESLDPQRIEIKAVDGRTYRAQVTKIPSIGIVTTLQDITYLKELDRIKTDFVNTVSHDLRSPLTAILGYVELIKRAGQVTPQQEEYIKRIQTSVHSITGLISDLLDLGRIEIGLPDEYEPVSLTPIVESSLNGVQPRVSERNQTLILELPDQLPAVYGDPIQLRQMLDNLVGNAVKYTPKGGHIILRGMEENGQVILQVEDNGRGIPLEEQSKIFDRFYRASNVDEESTGTGLGLAITKQIVENHRGRIWVDSSIDLGSVFTVVLPISKSK
jgi:two-component system phosphate regulon sensor histidine kinase PhoR